MDCNTDPACPFWLETGRVAISACPHCTGDHAAVEARDPERYRYQILDVCTELHGHVSGSFDELSLAELWVKAAWLKRRLEQWDAPALLRCARYDEAVKTLAAAALDEFMGHQNPADRTPIDRRKP